MKPQHEDWVLWGVELSPFALKVEALLRFAGMPYRWMPRSAGFREALRFELRRRRLVSGRLTLTWPPLTDLDEFPAVPFLFGPRGENLYDSSAIATWIDENVLPRGEKSTPLVPLDPALRLAVRLVDEASDELGLYLVHHNRWVMAARDNDAGARLAREMGPLLGPLAPLLRRFFPARQVRRLPYLFSVADPGTRQFADLPERLRPPSRAGFPPTHELLDRLFAELLAAVEPLLQMRPFLFGERLTLADASLYGQLGMNRTDPSANAAIRDRAPATHAWIAKLDRGDFTVNSPPRNSSVERERAISRRIQERNRKQSVGSVEDVATPSPAGKGRSQLAGVLARAVDPAAGEIVLDAMLAPLLGWICRGFVPLMRQNLAAYERQRAAGATRFNEVAFDRGEALYDGELLGQPFRSVVKTFQVRIWRDLRREWDELDGEARARLEAFLPSDHGLDQDL